MADFKTTTMLPAGRRGDGGIWREGDEFSSWDTLAAADDGETGIFPENEAVLKGKDMLKTHVFELRFGSAAADT